MHNIKYGFTLAESLVTVAIIALLASITMPMISNAQPNREMLMLKKAYFLVGRNVNEMINDDDLYPESKDMNNVGFSRISIADETGGQEAIFRGKPHSGKAKFCTLFAARMNLKAEPKCETGRTLNNGGSFITADGMIWVLPITDFKGANNGRSEIQIDVSGSKGDNCFEGANCKTPDRFTIYVDKNGVIEVPAKNSAGKEAIEQKYLTITDTTKKYKDLKSE